MTDREPFRAVVADPPWHYENGGPAVNGGVTYATMRQPELEALGPWVRSVTARSAALLLWATNPKLDQAVALGRAWGFTHRTAIPWVKTAGAGGVHVGVGYWARGCTEMLLLMSRGNMSPKRTGLAGLLVGEARTFYAPRGRHSQKPEGVQDFAERMPGPYLELFARRVRPGWVCLGHDTGWTLTPQGAVRSGRGGQARGWWAGPGLACARCGEPFVPRRSDARWCGPACRQAAYRSRVVRQPRGESIAREINGQNRASVSLFDLPE